MAAPSWLRWALALMVLVAGTAGVEGVAGALRSKAKGIGSCGCTWPPPDYTSNGDCAPKTALCGFCMNAAYSKYWYKDAKKACEPYLAGAKELCEKIAGEVGEVDLGAQYGKFGPGYGATAEFCKDQACC